MSPRSNTSAVATAPNVRKRRGDRIDAISNFLEGLARPSYTKLKNIHEVVCYSIWVDLIGLHIGNATEELFHNSSRYPYFALRMKIGLPEDLLKISEDLNDGIYELRAKERIMVFVQTMAYEQLVFFLDSCNSARFYREMMNNQICFVRDFRVLAHHTNRSLEVERTCQTHNIMKPSRVMSRPEFCAAYSKFASQNEDRLVFFLKILQNFRFSIGVVASARHLSDDLLAALRSRLQEFDQRDLYSHACSDVAWALPEESRFVADSKSWWFVTHCRQRTRTDIPRITCSDSKHGAALPDKVADAYSCGEKTRSALIFMIPTILLFSIIPAAMAWTKGESNRGTAGDSNFWQTVSSSILQLLSFVTFIWLALKDPRLSQITRVWIKVLVIFSAICAIASVPVYLVAPTNWSSSISLAGTLAQSVVQLQIINAV